MCLLIQSSPNSDSQAKIFARRAGMRTVSLRSRVSSHFFTVSIRQNQYWAGLRSGKPTLTTPALPLLLYSTHSVLSVYSYCDPTNKLYFWNKNTTKEKLKKKK